MPSRLGRGGIVALLALMWCNPEPSTGFSFDSPMVARLH